jgi:hypothetical protein
VGWLLEAARHLAEVDRPADLPAQPAERAPAGGYAAPHGREIVAEPKIEAQASDTAASSINLESLKVIADLAGKEYANENDRTKVLDAKSGPLIGATGAAIAFLVAAITKPPDAISTPGGRLTKVYYIAILGSIALLIVAQFFFLRSVRVRRTFKRFDLAPYATFESSRRPVLDIYAFVAGTYTALVAHNTLQNDRKARLQDIGLLFLLVGILSLIAVPITAAIAAVGR